MCRCNTIVYTLWSACTHAQLHVTYIYTVLHHNHNSDTLVLTTTFDRLIVTDRHISLQKKPVVHVSVASLATTKFRKDKSI